MELSGLGRYFIHSGRPPGIELHGVDFGWLARGKGDVFWAFVLPFAPLFPSPRLAFLIEESLAVAFFDTASRCSCDCLEDKAPSARLRLLYEPCAASFQLDDTGLTMAMVVFAGNSSF